MHAFNDIREECHHIVVAHGHVSHNLLQGNLFGSMILVFFAATLKLYAQFCDFALHS